MRQIVKQATRTNLWFFALTWFIGLWAFVKTAFLWPKICWLNVKETVLVLIAVALIMLVLAIYEKLLICGNKRQRMLWLIVAQQLKLMAAALLMEAGVILFITFINHALCV